MKSPNPSLIPPAKEYIINCNVTFYLMIVLNFEYIRSSASISCCCCCDCGCGCGAVTVRYSVGRFGLLAILACTSTWRCRVRSSLVVAHSSEKPPYYIQIKNSLNILEISLDFNLCLCGCVYGHVICMEIFVNKMCVFCYCLLIAPFSLNVTIWNSVPSAVGDDGGSACRRLLTFLSPVSASVDSVVVIIE